MPFDASQFLAGLRTAERQWLDRATVGTEKFGAFTIGKAQGITPVDTRPKAPHPGNLVASGTWGAATIKGGTIVVVVGFNADYAAAVHERLELHHEIGQAKYLETTLRLMATQFTAYIGGYIKP